MAIVHQQPSFLENLDSCQMYCVEYIRLVSIILKCINTTSIKNNCRHAAAIAQPVSFIETDWLCNSCKTFCQ